MGWMELMKTDPREGAPLPLPTREREKEQRPPEAEDFMEKDADLPAKGNPCATEST